MTQLKFDAKTGRLLPQKVRYEIKHSELDEETIEKYIKNECNFEVKCDNEGDLIFNEEIKIKKEIF